MVAEIMLNNNRVASFAKDKRTSAAILPSNKDPQNTAVAGAQNERASVE